MKHIICYSGGHESALVAIEVTRRYGSENVILLNHDITLDAEDQDIKQYKLDIANYLGLDITPCNASGKFTHLDPIKACMDVKAFKVGRGTELCCAKIKTEPFHKWLKQNFSDKNCIIYYGFPKSEPQRAARRKSILYYDMGYRVQFPLLWEYRTIHDTKEIGIPKPKHYERFIHGNCMGCLKAGWQHWYCIYVLRPDRWELAKEAEEFIGYSISRRGGKPCYLKEREAEFKLLQKLGQPATEHIKAATFWAMARKRLKNQGGQRK